MQDPQDVNAAAIDAPLVAPAEPPPADTPIRVGDRVASAIEVLFCSGVPTQVLLTLALHGVGLSPLRADGALSLRYVAILSLLDTILITSLVFVFLVSRGDSPRAVLLGRRPAWRESLLGLSLVVPILLGVGLLGLALRSLFPWLHNVPDNPLTALMRDPLSLAVFAVVVVLAGGVREELQRGFVLHRFRQHLGGAVLGLWLFSLAFGLGHLLQGFDAAILTGVLGLIWGWLFLRRGSIVAPMVSHAAFNLMEVARQAFAP